MLRVKLMPFKWNITERFMDTEEFIDWNTEPELIVPVSLFFRIMSTELITEGVELSFPKMIPTLF